MYKFLHHCGRTINVTMRQYRNYTDSEEVLKHPILIEVDHHIAEVHVDDQRGQIRQH